MISMQDFSNRIEPEQPSIQPKEANSWLDQQASAVPEIKPPHSTLAKKILLIASGLIVVLGGIAGYMFFGSGGKEELDLRITVAEELSRGVPADLVVHIQNSSGSDLADAQISLALPDNVIFVGVPGSRTVENRAIGTLRAGELKKETFTVMAVDGENTVAQFKAALSYVPGALRSRFEKAVLQDVVIAAAGIDLSLSIPGKVLSGEQFTTEVTYKNNSQINFEEVELLFKYPFGFTFDSADVPAASTAGTTWKIGTLAPNATGTIKIKGHFVGSDNAQFDLSAALNALVGEARYDVAANTASATLSPSPISLRIDVDGGSSRPITAGQIVTYRITYTNNTDIPLKDVIVTAKPIGEMFDLRTINSQGVLRASDNSIVWNASRAPDLASLVPGATGVVNFSIATKPIFPITRLSSKNFTVSVRAQAESKTVPANFSSERSLGIGEITTKMRGALGFVATALYRDAASGIVNAGALPVRVGQKTQFTVHWILKNTSTDVTGVKLATSLGPNVRYTGVFKSSTGEAPVYNERTQEFSWAVPSISATKGIISSPVELIFQIEIIPALDQIGEYPQLVGPVTGSYFDSFVEETRELKEEQITLALPDDITTVGVDKRVKE